MMKKRAQVVIGIGLLLISAAFLLIGLDYALLQGTFLTNGVTSASLFAQAISAAENSIAMSSGNMQITIYGNNSLCTWDPSLLAYVCKGGSKIANLSFAEGPTLDPGVEQFAGGICLSVMLNPLGKFGGAAEDEASQISQQAANGVEKALGATTNTLKEEGKTVLEDALDSGERNAKNLEKLGSDVGDEEDYASVGGFMTALPAVIYNNAKKSFLSSIGAIESVTEGVVSIPQFIKQMFDGQITFSLVAKLFAKFAIVSMSNYAVFYGANALVYLGLSHLSDIASIAKWISSVATTSTSWALISTTAPLLAITGGSRVQAADQVALGNLHSAVASAEIAQASQAFSPAEVNTSLLNLMEADYIANADPPLPMGILPSLSMPNPLNLIPSIDNLLPQLCASKPTLCTWSNTVNTAIFKDTTQVYQFRGMLSTLFLTWLGDARCLQIAFGSPSNIINSINGILSPLIAYEVQNDRSLLGTYYVGDTGAVYLEGEFQGRQMQVASPVVVDGQDLCEFAQNSPPPGNTLISYLQPAYNGNLVFQEYEGLFNTQCNPDQKGYPITLAQFINNIINGQSPVYINLPSDMALVFTNYTNPQTEQICIYRLAENSYGTPIMNILWKSPNTLQVLSNLLVPAINPSDVMSSFTQGIELFGFPIECIPATYVYSHTGVWITVSPSSDLLSNGTIFYVNSKNNIGFSVPPNSYADEFTATEYLYRREFSILSPIYALNGFSTSGMPTSGQYIPGDIMVSKVSAGLQAGTLNFVSQVISAIWHKSLPSSISNSNYASNLADTIKNIWLDAFGLFNLTQPTSYITFTSEIVPVLLGLNGGSAGLLVSTSFPINTSAGLLVSTSFAIVNTILASTIAVSSNNPVANLSFAPTDYASIYFSNTGGSLSYAGYKMLYGVYPNSPALVLNNEYTGKISSI